MKYKHLILKIVLAMRDEDYLFRVYHFILAKYRKEGHKAEHEEMEQRKPRLSVLCPNWKTLILSKAYTALLWVCCR